MEANYQDLYEANCTTINQLQSSNSTLQLINQELQLEIDTLKLQLAQIRRMIFGSKQEKFIPNANPEQLSLDIVAPVSEIKIVQEVSYNRVQVKADKQPSTHPGRYKLPEHLERKIIVIEPAEDTSSMKKIGEEITEELEIEPGKLFVNRYVRPKYVQLTTEQIIIAPMVERPLPKVIAGAGLLAQLMIDKYVDHLPIYRICERFKRDNVSIPYNTMVDWVGQSIKLITPLYEVLKKKVLASNYIHADETGIKVLDKEKKARPNGSPGPGSAHKGWLWAYLNSIDHIAFFDYQPTRGRAAPYELLEKYEGHLQVDGYSVYDVFAENIKIIILYCMAHARRKFFEAQLNDATNSAIGLEFFQKLYAIERDMKERSLTTDQILAERQLKSKPILDEFYQWMKNILFEVLPKSDIGTAIAYTLARWDGLCVYITDGKLNIDNNPVENSIRPIAIGRKNYLFAGSHDAAQRSAILYSLFATCKLNDINPYIWLKETLIAIPNHPVNRLEELLPIKKV